MRLHGEEQSRAHGFAVKKNGAAAAYPLFAADMSPGESEVIAEEISERQPWLDEPGISFIVHGHLDGAMGCHDNRRLWQS